MADSPRVSVIVPTYNRRASLACCLARLAVLDYAAYDVTVVDDGSNDDTAQFVRACFPTFRLLRRGVNGGPAAARNLGVAASTGDILAFTDDDCVVPRDWLRRHLRHFADSRVGAVGGPQVPSDPSFFDRRLLAHYADQFLRRPRRIERVEGWDSLWTCNLTVRREAFSKAAPFDEAFRTGSDSEFTRRLSRCGYVLVSDPDLAVEHLKVLSAATYLRRRFHQGCGSVLEDVKNGGLHARRFVPVPNLVRARHDWRRYREMFGGGVIPCAGFLALVCVDRWVDVAARAYYYWAVARHYRQDENRQLAWFPSARTKPRLRPRP